MPGREELPSTLQRSPAKAQETWIKAHDSAVEEYGEGERAHRTAFGALKHSFEKVGDHWEPKPGGAKPGLTAAVTGTYNAKTHAFLLSWTSQVVGGPFNGFTGEWHLTGTFVAKR